MIWNYDQVKYNFPLKKVGREVVREMLRIGVIVDISHTTPKTRDEVFEINRHHNEQRVKEGKTPRPLVFSHVGAQHIFRNTILFRSISTMDTIMCGMKILPESAPVMA